MKPDRITVFFPCHSLHDFPTWLDEAEADALLATWTAAWHPWLIATIGSMPRWASVDLPPDDQASLGFVPAPWDDRFAAQAEAGWTAGSRLVRGVAGHAAIVAAAANTLSGDHPLPAPLPDGRLGDEFQALGLAALLAELTAQRMRSSAVLTDGSFAEAAVRAARAAVGGQDDVARAALQECYGFLESTRAHYYPVDVWLLDIVLLADSTLGDTLDRELESPVPMSLVATGGTLEKLAAANPAARRRVQERCEAGTLAPAGGRYDSRPLDACTPEEIATSLERGLSAWRESVGTAPVTFAQTTGGWSAILPQVLTSLGFTGVIWTLFDGTPLPDPGSSRIRWEGTGGGCIDGVARAPLDARSAQMILSLPERLGDAMDHDHTAVVQFAHHVGTAAPWFDVLRRIGAASSVLGTFVTPPELFRRTAGAGMAVSFEPDVFPVALPPASAIDSSDGNDPVVAGVAAAKAEAVRLMAARESIQDALPSPFGAERGGVTTAAGRGHRSGWRLGSLLAGHGRSDGELVLEHESLRIQVHRQTGGLLSMRRPVDRGNRLSQRLAVRTTRPAPPAGHAWEDADERAVYSGMLADAIQRIPAADGRGEAIESRGRLVAGQNQVVGSFAQRIELLPGLPLAVIDIHVTGLSPAAAPLFEQHAACRFAWNENEDVDIRRSLHTQSIVTERRRFTAPWFIELCGPDHRDGCVVLLTGGIPWHVRSSPHMLDSILPTTPSPTKAAGNVSHRLAVGIGIDRPWDLATLLLADAPVTAYVPAYSAAAAGQATASNVRLTVDAVQRAGDRLVAARIGLLESAGRAGDVRLEWAAEVSRAAPCDAGTGRLPENDATIAPGVSIDGRSISVRLNRYEWRHLDLEFHR